jgi:ABC-2 type transport system permease protein
MTSTATSSVSQPDNLRFYILKLLSLRWVITVNGFKRAKPLRKAITLLLGLLVLAVFAGSYFLTSYFLQLADSPLVLESGVNLGNFVNAIPGLIVSGVFMGILLVSFGVLLQVLYLDNDMDFLLAAPIPTQAVFLTKLLQAILPNFILVLASGLPVLFSLGVTRGYTILYFPLVLVVLASLSLAAAGTASLLVMAVVRVLPAKRVAEVLAFLAAIFFIVLSQLTNLTGINLATLAPVQLSKGTQALSTLNSAWSPLAWGGRGLVDVGEGRWLPGIFFLALTLGLSGGVFRLAMAAAEYLYTSGWASIQESPQHKNTHRAVDRKGTNDANASIFRRLLPSEVLAIVRKDFKELRRDLHNMSQVIKPLILGILFAVMVLRSSGGTSTVKGEAPTLFMNLTRSALAYGSLALSLFTGWMVLLNLALISFSMEGKRYWMIKTAPVSAVTLLAAKFLIAYLPALIVSWLFMAGMGLIQKVTPLTMFYDFLSIALILAGLGGIMLAIGVRGTNLSWTDPRRMTDGVSSTVGLIAGFLALIAALLLFFAPVIGLPLLGIPELSGRLIGLLGGGTIALVCMILPLALVKNQVCRIGED